MKKIVIYNQYIETRGGGEKLCLSLAETLKDCFECEIILVTHSDVDLSYLGKYFSIDLSAIKKYKVDMGGFYFKLINKLYLPNKVRNIFLDKGLANQIRKIGADVFINCSYNSPLPSLGKKGIYLCMFPQKLGEVSNKKGAKFKVYVGLVNILRRLMLYPRCKNSIKTYDSILSISEFTQRYVISRWAVQSPILYPIADDMLYRKKVTKDKIILNVGRFFGKEKSNHHKRQDFLINSFSKMKDLHESGWELHLAGSVSEDVKSLKYILDLIKISKDLPIYFHIDCSFSELKDLYNKSAIYWHATGYGSNPKREPDKQEHFGITTVEAMSAECIPIVINSAGQKEIITSSVNGYLWSTQSQLKKYTRNVIKLTNDEKNNLKASVRKRSLDFNKQAFFVNVVHVFNKII